MLDDQMFLVAREPIQTCHLNQQRDSTSKNDANVPLLHCRPSQGPENGGQLKVVIPDIIVIASSKQRIPAKSA